MDSTFLPWSVVAVLFLVFFQYESRRRARRLPSFAGPMGLPVVGNLFDIRTNAAEQYRKWARTYGDAFQVQLGDIPILVVNSAAAAKAIFSGHSNALSSRPTLYTFHQIVSKTAGVTMGTSANSKSLSRSRKDTPLGKPAVRTYVKYLDLETRDFVRQCLDADGKPINPLRLLQRQSLSLDMMLCWGRRLILEDPLLNEIVQVEHEIVNLRNTMTNLQDCIPLLRLPWSKTTAKALAMRARRDAYFAQLNNEVDEARQAGTQRACIRSDLLDRADIDDEELNLICLTFISAGMAPTVATLQWSLALLATRPDIQETALAALHAHHIDTTNNNNATASTQLPLGDIEDDQGCAYIVALTKECLRYFTIARTSLPRSTVKDFTYNSHHSVPTGTTVFLNSWACNRDPAVWPDADADIFDPTRWLRYPDAPLFTFGLGSRACTGTLLANRLLYLFFVRVISAFEILPVGEIDADPMTGVRSARDLVSSPKDFELLFKPRDLEALTAALA